MYFSESIYESILETISSSRSKAVAEAKFRNRSRSRTTSMSWPWAGSRSSAGDEYKSWARICTNSRSMSLSRFRAMTITRASYKNITYVASKQTTRRQALKSIKYKILKE